MAIDYRIDYQAPPLEPAALADDPARQFLEWLSAAELAGLPEPNAMTLATASALGEPSARMLLLKSAGPEGFTFYTNYESAKAADLAENPRACLLFFWQPLHRQVRVSGLVERVSREESAAYFATRPRGAQSGAWASTQSAVLASREELEVRVAAIEAEYEGQEIPLPPHWGGYRLMPETVEFWQGRPNRLHDRIRYRLAACVWVKERLSP